MSDRVRSLWLMRALAWLTASSGTLVLLTEWLALSPWILGVNLVLCGLWVYAISSGCFDRLTHWWLGCIALACGERARPTLGIIMLGGYIVLFASAFVVLLRVVGVPLAAFLEAWAGQ